MDAADLNSEAIAHFVRPEETCNVIRITIGDASVHLKTTTLQTIAEVLARPLV